MVSCLVAERSCATVSHLSVSGCSASREAALANGALLGFDRGGVPGATAAIANGAIGGLALGGFERGGILVVVFFLHFFFGSTGSWRIPCSQR